MTVRSHQRVALPSPLPVITAARSDRDGSEPERARAGRRFHRPWFLPEGRRLSVEVWSQRHRGLTWLLWVHVPTLLAFALYRGETAASAAAQVGILAVAAAIAMVPFLSRNVRSSSTSIGLVVGASILVHIAGGSTTAHFQFFVILAFLTLYQAWTPYLLALGYVVLEHGVLGALDPHAVFNDQAAINHPWKYAAIHGIFVLAASFGNVLAWRLTEQEALHDSLTSLPNRAFFLDALTKSLDGRDRTSTAVLFLDLDNFKDANDGFGHDVGDALLQALSLRLRGWLRTGDVLARLGGDEFAIMLCDIGHSDEARRAAERVLAAFSEPVAIADITLACSASIGLAFADSDTESATDLLRNADLAMYEAKRDGGSRNTGRSCTPSRYGVPSWKTSFVRRSTTTSSSCTTSRSSSCRRIASSAPRR